MFLPATLSFLSLYLKPALLPTFRCIETKIFSYTINNQIESNKCRFIKHLYTNGKLQYAILVIVYVSIGHGSTNATHIHSL